MFGFANSRLVIEKRPDGNLLAYPTRVPGVSFPTDSFEAREGSLVKFHENLGKALAALTEEQRASACIRVTLDEDGDPEHEFWYFRVETEDDYATRIAKETADKAMHLEEHNRRRRELYEQLKAEFGD